VGRNFWLRLTIASAQCLRRLRALFSFYSAFRAYEYYTILLLTILHVNSYKSFLTGNIDHRRTKEVACVYSAGHVT